MPLPFQLTESQWERIKPSFPLSHGVARLDDRRVISGIVYVIRNGLPGKDAPREYGPHKTLYNRFVRWSRRGVFNRIFQQLAQRNRSDRLMIDATHWKAHRTAASWHKKELFPRCIGRPKGGLNSKLPAVCDGSGKPIARLLSEGQMSDDKGAALRWDSLPKAAELLADRGYDADWFRAALIRPGITPCIPAKKNRKQSIEYDKVLYKQRHKIENMFAKLKDWRRIALR
jgi:transposase